MTDSIFSGAGALVRQHSREHMSMELGTIPLGLSSRI